MSYKNVLHRFSIDRIPDEDQGEFMERVIIITNARMSILNGDYGSDLDENTNYIFDEKDTASEGSVISAVVEIVESPQEAHFDNLILLTYRDNIKQKNELSGEITDISLENVIYALEKEKNKINNILSKVNSLKQRTFDF